MMVDTKYAHLLVCLSRVSDAGRRKRKMAMQESWDIASYIGGKKKKSQENTI